MRYRMRQNDKATALGKELLGAVCALVFSMHVSAPAYAQWQPLDPAQDLPPLEVPDDQQGIGNSQGYDSGPAFDTTQDYDDDDQTFDNGQTYDNDIGTSPDYSTDQGTQQGFPDATQTQDDSFDPYGQDQTVPETDAKRVENPVAVFSGLDKITARITSFDVYIGETVQFGALQLTPKVCHTSPASENPQTTAFVQVDEITLNNEVRRIFSGWMYAGSPGLHAVEHPVYDVWLTDCKKASSVPPPEGYDGPPVEAGAEHGLDPLAGDVETGKIGVPIPKP